MTFWVRIQRLCELLQANRDEWVDFRKQMEEYQHYHEEEVEELETQLAIAAQNRLADA